MNRRTAPSSRHTRATGRWRFLADASAALDTSIEYEQTLANTVRLAVPEVADYCVVILVDEEGATRWADSTHRDPAKRALLESLRGFVPPASPDHPIRRALRTGRPQLVTNAGAQILKWWDGTRLSAVRELAPDSTITVPMIARGRTFGAILFSVTAESGRRYGGPAKARDELMAVVAHDLKNPLNTIQLALRALLDDGGSGDDEGAKRALERPALGAIQRAADRMYRLIHDLLDVARADAGRLWIQPAPADPEVLLREALEAHCQVAAAKGVTLEAAADEPLPSVLADRERIAQVFSNLIGNALKFTPGGGRVSVRGWRATPGVRFAVEDTGPGIPRDQQPHVFDRFWQATNAPAMGTGLGLSIAKAIVEGHGGSIKVDSAPGQGTRFEFSLPMAGETSVDAEPGPPGSRPDRPWATACAQPGARPPTSAAQRVGA